MADRMFIAPISITASFSAQIDIFELFSGTNMPLRLNAFELGQVSEVGDAQEEGLILILKRVTAAPTSGSGGNTPTPIPVMPSEQAVATGTVLETGNTTKLSGGTSVELARFAWNVRGPCLYRPLPDEMPVLAPATRLVLELATTPADAIVGVYGWLTFGEMI